MTAAPWRVFGRIGVLSFGGPAAQIALMHRELVEQRGWLSEAEYLRALSFCMLLPGPEAMQLATYAGWKLGGVRMGLVAGLWFVLPGATVVLGLAALYAAFGTAAIAQGLFLGIKAAVVAIVIEALLRVAKRALKGSRERTIAGLAFAAIYGLGLPFPLIVGAAGLAGAVLLAQPGPDPAPLPPNPALLRRIAIGLALWWAPVVALAAGGGEFLLAVGLFFSKLAVVTFGGAYAVLAYMTQTVVGDFGWLTTPQMMDALGLAETTPGPLILVTEFVAYVAGAAEGGTGLGLAAAALTLWVTFVPCFLWVFAFAPYVEWIATRPRLGAALSGISASVVGVIGALALWFAEHVFFAEQSLVTAGPFRAALPVLTSFDPVAAGIGLAAGWLLLLRHWPLPLVLGLAALAGGVTQIL
ncbi:MAG: chromate efflux transporter [Rhodobacteraceae bacterium]|nr:chromate efflux transporter [Paracoccaceae bacterium]